ncbi:MAG: phosphoribosylanthranilate isomerase [Pseudomonadales bacterium]|nr:phosphoribosylanthranilate isomerase [Pseudomonadales bacterium]
MRTRVKICGITNIDDAIAAIDLGADALGFNLYEPSPRYLRASGIKKIVDRLPPFVTCIGLFVNADKASVEESISLGSFDLLQFHGDETDDFCRQFSRPFIKAIRVKRITEIDEIAKAFPSCKALLVDALVDGKFGGTGESLNWDGAPFVTKPIILAGGLTPLNVSRAIQKVQPFSVDVSSGVECEPGRKDKYLMQSFMNAVRSTDTEISNTEVVS